MNLSERKKRILCAAVELYVKTVEPVGSKAIVSALGSSMSSATVRSEMAELESIGLLEQPHTSAGRVPTALGYRLYVNELMQKQSVPGETAMLINSALGENLIMQPHMLDEVGSLTSRLTTYPAYAMAARAGAVTIVRFDFISIDSCTFIIVALLSNDTVKNKLVHLTVPYAAGLLGKMSAVFNASFTGLTEDKITTALITATERATGDTNGIVAIAAGFVIELLVEEKAIGAHVSGAVNLLSHPEYRNIDKAQQVFRYLSDAGRLAKLPSPDAPGEVKITIGPENLAEELKDSSVVAVKYDAGDSVQGLIGVIGPTRMDYSKVTAHLTYIAQGLSLLLSGTGALQGAALQNALPDDDSG